MPALVVDTDVVSFQVKGDSRAAGYDSHLAGNFLFVSFMTLAELDLWALQSNWGAARLARLATHLQKFAQYPYDRDLCRWWAETRNGARRRGRPIGVADAWVAATALILNVPLVTHNPGDFAGVDGLSIISSVGP